MICKLKNIHRFDSNHFRINSLFAPGRFQKSILSTNSDICSPTRFSRRFLSSEANATIEPKTGRRRQIFLLSSSIIIGAVLFAVLDHKRTEAEVKKHEISNLTLEFKRGGPKQLPIASHFTDEKDFSIGKPRLVILGSGWGAVSLIKELEKDKYHVTVISPQNYFLFTPLLPSATVGTLEARSLLEPIRGIIKHICAHYLEARATDVCFDEKLVEVSTGPDGDSFYVPYDKLVIAVGSKSITHGIEGIEHCHFLKTINDARAIRKTIMDNIEKASLPTTSSEERKRLLSFVVCGGGPTGVEFAAELYDFLTEDVVKYQFPTVLRKEVQVSIIQGSDHILNTYDKKISDFAEKKFKRDNINVITNARVQKVKEDHIIYKKKNEDEERELKYGLCLWSTGIAMSSLTKKISEKLPEQKNMRALVTDNRLRLMGIPDSSVYAIGDCSTVKNPKLVENLMKFFTDADVDNSGALSYAEFQAMAKKISRKYPITADHLKKANILFATYDKNKSGTLELDELHAMLDDIDKRLTSLPATAQVAHQQGKYLAKKLNKLALERSTAIFPSSTDYSVDGAEKENPDMDDRLEPFNYAHLGSLAYIGNSAVADFGTGYTWTGGWSAVYLWRSIYFSEQVSLRTRVLLALDWTKGSIFGRDISKF
ncbi:518_t:CDS:10 [Acaulospora morrowiae]|uniref:518_t:CDS:1 n=1 Tax=Acaulospora morrowiae TaxID=94023 RepID=A0A9N8VVS3_9GLOM|nr:518_t:CDS:10 [Acaulospora morrowiae]